MASEPIPRVWEVDAEVKRRFLEKGKGPKPMAREEPLPDLIVTTQEFEPHSGTPKVVTQRLKEMKAAERDRIGGAWKAAGKTIAYIPNTPQARRLHEAARLKNRVEAKHAAIVQKNREKVTRQIELVDAVTIPSSDIL